MFLFVLLVPFLSAGCQASTPSDPGPNAVESYQYQVPEATDDGWATAGLEAVGLDRAPLVELMDRIHGITNHLIHSILIVRNGKLVFEEYFPGEKVSLAQYTGETGFTREDTHNLASVTKSITSTLVGSALDLGWLESVETPVFDFFPDHEDLLQQDPRRARMTVEHLLLMTAGLSWNDETVPYSDPANNLVQMFNSGDPIRFALSTPLFADPGAEFEYCNANTNILGVVVERASGLRLDQFSASSLFSPLGIEDFEWQVVSPEMFFASGDLRLRPRDMAKIGQLFLNGGTWEGVRIISSDWVERATSRIVIPDGPHSWADAYGYGWWHRDLQGRDGIVPVFFAAGWGEQMIYVVPLYDMVVVTTGGAYFSPIGIASDRVLSDYVFRAVR